MASQAGFFPVETYRSSSVTNGGTTVQSVTRVINESKTGVDTKDITDTKDLTETIQADVGGAVKFSITNKNITPIQIPQAPIRNPNTT